jgi:cell division septal protein FtsQ
VAARIPVRHPVAGRRVRVTRASSRLTRTRFVAAATLLLASGVFQWLTVAHEFALDPDEVRIEGLVNTSVDAALEALGLEGGLRPNVFRIRTDTLREELLSLPAVTQASVEVMLPDRLLVTVDERRPIFVWRAGGADHLVDLGGVLFASADGSGAGGLPLIEDRRSRAPARLGDRLEPLDLEVVRLLGAVTPEMLDSAAPDLSLTIDDADGFVLTAPTGWRAVFGHYTPHLRTAGLVDDQVQCLRALLSGQERRVETVFLSPSAERCGTYVPRVGRQPPEPAEPSETPDTRREP